MVRFRFRVRFRVRVRVRLGLKHRTTTVEMGYDGHFQHQEALQRIIRNGVRVRV